MAVKATKVTTTKTERWEFTREELENYILANHIGLESNEVKISWEDETYREGVLVTITHTSTEERGE